MRIIDAHIHVGVGRRMQLAVDDLLRLMDEAGVALAVACPMDRPLAVAPREGNDLLLETIGAHGDRLAGMAVANPWFGDAAEQELRRALAEGLVGLKIHSLLQGFRLGEHLVDPLLEVAGEFEVPVYVHTGTAGAAEPFGLIELARRFPAVRFVMGHAGASDYYNDAVRGLEFADNVWIETSRNGPGNFCHWRSAGALKRVVFGSNAPEYIPAVEMANLRDVFPEPDVQADIFGATLEEEVFRGRLPV